jgi:hypothetical protein
MVVMSSVCIGCISNSLSNGKRFSKPTHNLLG